MTIQNQEIKDKIKIGSTNNIDTRITELSCGSPERFKILNIESNGNWIDEEILIDNIANQVEVFLIKEKFI